MLQVILCAILCLVLQTGTARAEYLGPDINVGLVVGQFSAEVASAGKFVALVPASGKTYSFEPGKIFVSVKNGTLQLNAKEVEGSEIELLAKEPAKHLEINRKSYRGRIVAKLDADKKALTVINILPVEEYLYGVVAKEIVPLWPEEAIKAQAVAARSFALSRVGQKKITGYDIRSNELGQVYGGLQAEHPITNKQIDATRGIAVTYGGKPIEAYFHSCSGGYTENSENIWGTYLPYLRGVSDYDQEAPKFKWEKSYTPAQLLKILEQAGYKIGKLETIKLSPRKEQPIDAKDRGVSGRVLQLTIKGDLGSAVIDGGKLRTILQLNSTLFDIVVETPVPKFIEVPILDSYGNEIGKKKIPVNVNEPNKPSYLEGFENIRLITGGEGETIIFKGNGWGHGVGMSQWGARGMALSAPLKSKDYFKTILLHYYTDTKVEKIY